MRKRNRKMLSLLLAVAMVFSMNTFAFAEEVVVEEVPAGVSEVLDNETVADEGGAVVVDEEVLDLASEEGLAGDIAAEDDGVIAVDDAASEADGAVEIVADDLVEGADAVLEDAEDAEVAAAVSGCTASGDWVLSENATLSENLNAKEVTKLGNYYVVYDKAVASTGNKRTTKAAVKAANVEVYKAKTGANVTEKDLVSENKVNSTSFDKVPYKKVKIHVTSYATVDLTGKLIVAEKKSAYISKITLSDKAAKKEMNSLMKSNKYKLQIMVYPAYAGNDDEAKKLATKLGLKTVDLTVDTSKKKVKATGTAEGKKVTLKVDTKGKKPQKGYIVAGSDTKNVSKKGNKYYICGGNFAGNIFYN